jgi:AcrR family transcriptional regulator
MRKRTPNDAEEQVAPKRGPAKRAPAAKSRPKGEAAGQKRLYLPAEERRRLIIQAAQEVFAEGTLQSATTRKLAAAADVNVATLFQHFGSKEELFIAAVVEPLLEHMHDMDATHAVEQVKTGRELRELILPGVERNLRVMIDVYPLLVAALFSSPQIGKRIYCEHIVPIIKERTERLRRFLPDTIDPEVVCIAGFGVELAIAMDRYFRSTDTDVEVLARHVRDVVFSNLRATPKPLDDAAVSPPARRRTGAPRRAGRS